MTAYQDKVSTYSPVYYFKADESAWPVAHNGSATLTSGSNLLQQQTDNTKWTFANASTKTGTGSWYNDGADYMFRHTDTTAIFQDRTFSISFWIKLSSSDFGTTYTRKNIFGTGSKTTSGGSVNISAYRAGTSNINIAIETWRASNSFVEVMTSGVNVADGNWHHVLISTTGGTVNIYVDGTIRLNGGDINIGTFGTAIDTSTKYFGSNHSGTATDAFKGYLDEFAIFNTALSATDATDLSYAGNIADPMVASTATMVHPRITTAFLKDLAVTDNAAYIFSLDTTETLTGAAMSGHTVSITTAGTYTTTTDSPTGGTKSYITPSSGSYSKTYTDSATPAVVNVNGTTIEAIFKHTANLANGSYGFIYIKEGNGGRQEIALALFGDATGTRVTGTAFTDNSSSWGAQGATYLQIGNWYHVVFEWGVNGNAGGKLYVNNVLDGSIGVSTPTRAAFDDTNIHTLLSNPLVSTVDFIAIYNEGYNSSYLTADKRAEHYAAFNGGVSPLGALNVSAAPSTASALFVNPVISTQKSTVYTTDHMEAFGELPMPAAGAIDNVSVSATVSTGSALFADADWSHDSGLAASHMIAHAEIVEPIIFIAGVARANPMIATNASLPHPGINALKNAVITPSAMTARGKVVIPSNFTSLFDDMWYSRLYAQHATPVTEGLITTNLPGETPLNTAKAFLKFFEDVTIDLSGTTNSINRLANNIPDSFVNNNPSGAQTYTYYGQAINSVLTGDVLPSLQKGFFDDYDRKSVKLKNIEFDYSYGNTYFPKKAYTLEFTIKTTAANQIIAKGAGTNYGTATTLYYMSSLGLIDGKLYGMEHTVSAAQKGIPFLSHPDNYGYIVQNSPQGADVMYGNKRIDDGNWHHIVVQYIVGEGVEGRLQFWIDGKLDVQSYIGAPKTRLNILGGNSDNPRYMSDFEVSGWSYNPGSWLPERDLLLNYAASFKYEPIKAEVISGTVATMGQNTVAKGNRKRALYLYFDPAKLFNKSGVEFDIKTDPLAGQATIVDKQDAPPPRWFDWDVFPVDVTGYYVSELVKPEAYGGSKNIELRPVQTDAWWLNPGKPNQLVNKRGAFRDPITDDRRYIDLINDVDLSQFDIIMFHNYPDNTYELDSYAREDLVDDYFGIKERTIYEQFVKSVRAAVDTGISLLITNPQLALDLGIIDRVEEISQFNNVPSLTSDPYAPTIIEGTYSLGGFTNFSDVSRNNKHRLVNTLADLTDYPSWINTAFTYYNKDNEFFQEYTGFSRPWDAVEWKQSGLTIGTEFLISHTLNKGVIVGGENSNNLQAVPFTAVKAGKAITALGAQFRNGTTIVDNPYKDYATTIAVSPGDVLNGTQCGGKIFVDFTEIPEYTMGREYEHSIELLTDERIDRALADKLITQDQATEYKALTANYDRRLALGNVTQEYYDIKLKPWTYNGANEQVNGVWRADANKQAVINQSGNFTSPGTAVGKTSASIAGRVGADTSAANSFSYYGIPFGNLKTGTPYPQIGVFVPSMLTRGIWWLSERILLDGTYARPTALEVNGTMPMPTIIVDKVVAQNAQAMLAIANLAPVVGTAPADVSIAVLPLEANAIMTQYTKFYNASPMTATALLASNYRILTTEIDQVVLYLDHVDPILYLREEVIK